MNILYVTFESYEHDPIIKSQVVRLLERIIDKSDFTYTLLTFDNCEDDSSNSKLNKIFIKNRGNILNFISLLYFLLCNYNKYQAYHVRGYTPMIPILLLKFFFDVKVLFDPRGLYPEELIYSNKRFFSVIYYKLEYFFLKYANVTVVVSDKFREYYVNKYGFSDKIYVIRTFSELPKANVNLDVKFLSKVHLWENDIIIVFSGAYSKWQLPLDVIDFFSKLSKLSDNFKFIVFTPHVDQYYSLLDAALPSDMFLIRSLSPNELTTYLSFCDYGIIFRENILLNNVAAPIKFNDYLLSGLEVILSDNIGDTAQLVHANSWGYILKSFAEKDILDLIKSLKKRRILSKESVRQSAMLFLSIDICAIKYINLYNKYFK